MLSRGSIEQLIITPEHVQLAAGSKLFRGCPLYRTLVSAPLVPYSACLPRRTEIARHIWKAVDKWYVLHAPSDLHKKASGVDESDFDNIHVDEAVFGEGGEETKDDEWVRQTLHAATFLFLGCLLA